MMPATKDQACNTTDRQTWSLQQQLPGCRLESNRRAAKKLRERSLKRQKTEGYALDVLQKIVAEDQKSMQSILADASTLRSLVTALQHQLVSVGQAPQVCLLAACSLVHACLAHPRAVVMMHRYARHASPDACLKQSSCCRAEDSCKVNLSTAGQVQAALAHSSGCPSVTSRQL
jgi:hypothetical protein